MSSAQAYFRQQKVVLAVALPIILQVVFFAIMLPPLHGTTDRLKNLTVAVVNADPGMGSQIAAQIAGKLPFTVMRPDSLAAARTSLENGDVQMLMSIPEGFGASLRTGGASIDFTVDPHASTATTQIMTGLAQGIVAQINATAFAQMRQAMAQGVAGSMSAAPVPPAVAQQLSTTIGSALGSLNPSPVSAHFVGATVQAGNAPANPISGIVPMFVVLLGTAGAVAASALLWLSRGGAPRWRSFALDQIALAAVAVVLPWVTIGSIVLFAQPLAVGVGTAWWTLALAYWTMLEFCMGLVRLLGRAGVALAAILIPFQLIATGVLLPRQLLPGFYSWLAQFMPASHAVGNVFTLLSGGSIDSGEAGGLVLIGAAGVLVAALGTLIPRKRAAGTAA